MGAITPNHNDGIDLLSTLGTNRVGQRDLSLLAEWTDIGFDKAHWDTLH